MGKLMSKWRQVGNTPLLGWKRGRMFSESWAWPDYEQGYQGSPRDGIDYCGYLKAATGGDLSRIKAIRQSAWNWSIPAPGLHRFTRKSSNGFFGIWLVEVFGELGKHARSAVGVRCPYLIYSSWNLKVELSNWRIEKCGVNDAGYWGIIANGMLENSAHFPWEIWPFPLEQKKAA